MSPVFVITVLLWLSVAGLAFALGLLVIPFALETRGQRLPG